MYEWRRNVQYTNKLLHIAIKWKQTFHKLVRKYVELHFFSFVLFFLLFLEIVMWYMVRKVYTIRLKVVYWFIKMDAISLCLTTFLYATQTLIKQFRNNFPHQVSIHSYIWKKKKMGLMKRKSEIIETLRCIVHLISIRISLICLCQRNKLFLVYSTGFHEMERRCVHLTGTHSFFLILKQTLVQNANSIENFNRISRHLTTKRMLIRSEVLQNNCKIFKLG